MKSFKDLKVWQASSRFSRDIYAATGKFPHSEIYGLTNQMRRAVVSISSNIAEGFARFHKKEKLQFYAIAYGSAAELESQIEVAHGLSFIDAATRASLLSSLDEIQRMMQGLIKASSRSSSASSSHPLPPQSSILDPSSGFTLVELLVSIGLFAIIVSIAASGFVSAIRTQRQVASLISAQSNVSLVLEQMAREIRTGYLFCHDADSTSPTSTCGCTVSGSQWTCDALDYYTAQSAHVDYSLKSGALAKSDSTASDPAPQSITGSDVSVKYLHFTLFGNLQGDHWTPRVTIAIGIAPSSTDPAVASDVINFETTVSARAIDCDASGSC